VDWIFDFGFFMFLHIEDSRLLDEILDEQKAHQVSAKQLVFSSAGSSGKSALTQKHDDAQSEH
jgi:hypothetical protein